MVGPFLGVEAGGSLCIMRVQAHTECDRPPRNKVEYKWEGNKLTRGYILGGPQPCNSDIMNIRGPSDNPYYPLYPLLLGGGSTKDISGKISFVVRLG